jgi:hypothetical protein
MSNDEWRIMFPEAIVKVLPRIEFSDHHPIIIMLQGIPPVVQRSKFRFEKAWMYHPNYTDLIKQHWNKRSVFPEIISNMTDEFVKWKCDVFGSINKRKADLMARINGIQRKQHVDRNNKFLERLERNLQQELMLVLKQEEAVWFQKSRSQWIKDGDRNTRYYHVKTINRRRRNRIMMLKNDHNEWVEDDANLKEMVNNYYKNLFARIESNIQWQQTRYSYPHIHDTDYDNLKPTINHMEVKKALFDMSPWIAPASRARWFSGRLLSKWME